MGPLSGDVERRHKFYSMFRKLAVPVFLLFLLRACTSPVGVKEGNGPMSRGTGYARGFSLERYGDICLLRVRDPWQGSSGIHLEYLVIPPGAFVPDSLSRLERIEAPVSRIICMSTTHVAMINALGMSKAIVGISGSDYISDPRLRERLEAGEVADVGADQTLDYERIVSLKPDLVMAYGITAEVGNMVKRLGRVDIPVVLNGDYLENEPLGKTEWLKFVAVFFSLEARADSLFAAIEKEYRRYGELAAGVPGRPRVLTGLPWKDTWYVPGGKSYAAAFIRDAGGQYLWSDNDSHEAFPVDLESVVSKGSKADFWINCGSAASLEDIRRTEPRLVPLGPLQQGEVYNNTARINPFGGNDFWENGVMEPHLILADLIRIFHPELLPGHDLRYYRQLQ